MPTTTIAEWGTIAAVADLIGCSRRTLERALKGDGEADGHTVEQRDTEEGDFARPDVTRRTTRMVRATNPDGEVLTISVEMPDAPPRPPEPEEEYDEDEDDDELEEAIRDRVSSAMMGESSPEETLAWLELVRTGQVKEEKMTGGASRKPVKVPASLQTRTKAAVEAEKLRQFLDERERNFIPRMDVANALVTVGSLLRHRMQAVPARLSDRVANAGSGSEAREILADEIHAILTELGDATERELEKLLRAEAA